MPSYPQMVPPALYNLQLRDIAAYLSTLPRVPPGAPDVPAGWQPNQFSGIPPTGTWQPEAWMAPRTRRPEGVLMPERVIPTPPELASIAPPTPEPLGPDTAPYAGLIPGEIPDNPWGNSPQIQSYQQPPEMPGGVPRPEIGGANAAMAQPMTQQQPAGRQPFAQLNQVPPNPMQSAAQMPQGQMPQGQQQPGQQGGSNAMLMGILSAGLGILANNTGHYGAAGPAIGRGGQIGLGTYLQQSQQEIENTRRDALAKAAEARWQQQAEYNRQIGGIAVASEGRAAAKDQAATAIREKNQRLMSEYQMASPERKNQIVRELTMESKPEEILKLEHGAKNSAFSEKVSALTHSLGKLPMSPEARTMLAEGIVAGRFVESRDPVTGAATIIDLGKQGSGGSAGSGGGYGGGQAQSANAPATAVDPSLDASLGTGGTGFFQGWANKIAGVVDYPLPYPDTDKAINALTNMQVQTTAKLQEAVPGRPSNMLMSQLGKLTVTPGSLFQGDEASFNKLTQTRDMLATEFSRMEREILSGATPVKPEELSKTRVNHSELRQLLAEYDALLKNFGAYQKKKTPQELLDDIKRGK